MVLDGSIPLHPHTPLPPPPNSLVLDTIPDAWPGDTRGYSVPGYPSRSQDPRPPDSLVCSVLLPACDPGLPQLRPQALRLLKLRLPHLPHIQQVVSNVPPPRVLGRGPRHLEDTRGQRHHDDILWGAGG